MKKLALIMISLVLVVLRSLLAQGDKKRKQKPSKSKRRPFAACAKKGWKIWLLKRA